MIFEAEIESLRDSESGVIETDQVCLGSLARCLQASKQHNIMDPRKDLRRSWPMARSSQGGGSSSSREFVSFVGGVDDPCRRW